MINDVIKGGVDTEPDEYAISIDISTAEEVITVSHNLTGHVEKVEFLQAKLYERHFGLICGWWCEE